MTEGKKILRLSKVAKEFNIGITTIVEFLGKKGFAVDSNPNAKLPEEAYDLLFKEFQSEKNLKEATKKVGLGLMKRESLAIDQEETGAEKKPEEKKAAQPEKEEKELFIKDMKGKVGADTAEPAKPSRAEEKPAEEKPQERPAKEPEAKPVEDIEEKAAPDVPAKEEKPAEEKASEKAVQEPEPKKEEEEKKGPGLKVLGKIELEEKKPAKKDLQVTKKDRTEEQTPEKQPEKEEAPVKDLPLEEVAAEKDTDQDKTDAPEPEQEDKPGEKKDNIHRTEVRKLEGPTILGRMELPKPKEISKTPVASSADPNKSKRRKRKRIKKDKTGESTPSPTVQQSAASDAHKGRKPVRRDHLKPELTDEEISRQIKETLASLSGTGKSKASRHRRLKREMVQQQKDKEREKAADGQKTLHVTEFISASELANLMNVSVNEVISTCMSLGLFVSINQRLDAETITIVCDEFGFDVEFVSVDMQDTIEEEDDDPADLRERAPIVTVMGHVDHGKTSLLDQVRHSNIIAGEAGGITQHIGAYAVELDNNKTITFLDTPGHEAFTAMRARGAKVTDVAIIVVAADDNVMPQTVEAINHAQAAGVPIVIAINKIDKSNANPEKVKEELANINILVEDWGGKYQCQEISAKEGRNIDNLLEKVLLEAEMLELKSNPGRRASGTVIESSLDKGRGYLATILVQNGTLRLGSIVVAGTTHGKVKAMFNERGQRITEAGPSTPVLMLGLDGAPQAGDIFNVMESEHEAKSITTKRHQLMREQGLRTHKHITLDEIGRRIAIGDFKELNVIVKGDVDGSVEALSDSLLKLGTEEVQVSIIHKAVGAITEGDVLLASASNAIIIGFQVRPSVAARKLAESEQIDIRLYSIIYNAINEIKSAIEGMLSPEIEEKILANLEVREVFKITKVGTVAGCMVLDGKIHRNSNVRIIRDGIVVYTGYLGSLKRFKEDVKEVSSGYECGLNIDRFNDIKVRDIIEAYETIEVARKLE
jgi:translation initiation factor IF-2